MKKLIITCSNQDILDSVYALVIGLQSQLPPSDLKVTDEESRRLGARVRYHATRDYRALRDLCPRGTTNKMALIFGDVLNQPMSEQELQDKHPDLNSSTLVTSLAKLRQNGYIESRPIQDEETPLQAE